MATTTEYRSLQSFSELENLGTADVIFIPSPSYRVSLTGREEDIKRTYTDLHGDMLKIWQDSNEGGSSKIFSFGIFHISHNNSSCLGPVTVTVEAPTLKNLLVKGTGKFFCKEGELVCPKLEVSLEGSSQVIIEHLDCQGDAKFSVMGVGDISVSGKVKGEVKAILKGVGNISGSLTYAKLNRSVSGLGNINF